VKAHEMLETLTPTAARSNQVVLPAHAAEPAATFGYGARRDVAWRAPSQGDKLNALLPGGGSDALTLSNTNVFTRKSLFVRWAAPDAKRLEAERRAAREGAGGATLMARGRSDLATASRTGDDSSS
jgi:hypothetical protein